MKSNFSNKLNKTCFLLLFSIYSTLLAAYPDQHYIQYIDSLHAHIESIEGVEISEDGQRFELSNGVTSGYIIFEPMSSSQPYNRGLPSWNGTASDNRSSFKIQMRFPYGDGWSPWLTVGFWKSNIWSSYGAVEYNGGEVDYDYIKLYAYQSGWQFKVIMKRYAITDPSPTIHKLSFFISDTRTTAAVDHPALLNDNPEPIFVDTDFLYQYAIDDIIGGSICSPTSVSMVLLSYDIDVDPYQFALDTKDPYYGIFGIWPRVVQNASEYGLDGAVTRYRSWSETREVLAGGGRIVISVGPPLYSGHLMMLAGFTANGNPIIHDPARSNGYSYIFDKGELGHSWYDKGGIAYTFYLSDSIAAGISDLNLAQNTPADFQLHQNYPNPFNPQTSISFYTPHRSYMKLVIYDVTGRKIQTVIDKFVPAGDHSIVWDAAQLPSGTYFIHLTNGRSQQIIKSILLK